MASIIRNEQRGTWQVQWNNGVKWVRATVVRKRAGWKTGDSMPKKPPPEVLASQAAFQRKEDGARLNRPASSDDLIEGFLSAYRAGYVSTRRPGSVVQLDFSVARFLGFCKEAKIKRREDVTPDAVDRYINFRFRTVGHSSVKKEVGLLAGAWSKAVKLRRITENPWRLATVPGKAKRRKSSWTADEYSRLLAACRPWLRDLVTLGCHTGLRVTALTNLEWRDVSWNRSGSEPGLGSVVVRPELDKAKDGYSVPMSGACHDLLSRLNADRGSNEFVLSGQGGRPVKSARGVGAAIHLACVRAGLTRPDSPCHAMRRTFGRWAVLGELSGRPVPLYVVSRWMGHHSVKQTEDYLDLNDRTSQEWMAPPPSE